ncbi:MAG TPA: T9SS type A sorting domain-containing protein [Flavobacterium sp.]|uniref:T9SS type A sorting domain-containing protein n=1 Tax=Flavobacterium sp. TaxID=239 RepID=UPI002C8EAEBF|nr:T9SS type A sorting domain-containing protein [Flavobacterium sp.]HSD13510.1 T9SS type A sorting domain-containing protein [Flavobacterium sp.]
MKKYCLLLICVLCLGNSYMSLAQGAPQLQWVFNAVDPAVSGGDSFGRSIALDSSGNVYVAGSFSGTADFDPSVAIANLTSVGGSDIFMAKYDSNGNYLWAKRLGDVADEDYATCIAVSNNGEIYVSGHFQGTVDFDPSVATANLVCTGYLYSDMFIAKYDNNGNYIWAKAIGGDNGWEYTHSLAVKSNGELCITGRFNGIADFDPSAATVNLTNTGNDDIFIAKYDTNGNYLWAKSMQASESYSLALNSIGEIYITGNFINTVDFDPSAATANLTAAGNNDIFFAKYDNNGNYLWAKAIGGTSSDVGLFLVLNSSNEIYITGYFRDSVDFDPSAAATTLTSLGNGDVFLAKYDSSGNYLWAKGMGGVGSDVGLLLVLNSNGEPYVSGFFNGTVDMDPSSAAVNLTSAGGRDIFVAKYDVNGNYLWAKAMGGMSNDEPMLLALNNVGELYMTGYFQNTADFESASDCGSLTSLNGADFFLAKYANGTCTAVTTPSVTQTGNTLTVNSTAVAYQWIDCNNGNNPVQGATNQSFTPAVNGNYAVVLTKGCCQSISACQSIVLGINEEEMALVTLYPNPTTGNFTISWADAQESAEIVVTDIMGKTIKTMYCEGQQEARLSLDGAANGIYFVRLQSEQKTKLFKVIKK